jgi:hypothetical protein
VIAVTIAFTRLILRYHSRNLKGMAYAVRSIKPPASLSFSYIKNTAVAKIVTQQIMNKKQSPGDTPPPWLQRRLDSIANKKPKPRCERCGKKLNIKGTVWLELSLTDGRYYENIPLGHESQGRFSFGPECWKQEIK